MAKKKDVAIEEKPKGKLQEAFDKLNKTYGEGTILTMDSKTTGSYDVISSGSIGVDAISLGTGGFVKGKLYELMGWEGCLAESTFIKFINVRKDGIVQDCKGGTIKNLYNRFHNRTNLTEDSKFHVVSINEQDRVFRNEIADVVKSGKKECFELITEKGYKINATKDHKFYTGTQYLPLSNLKVGDFVYIHNNTTFKKDKLNPRKDRYLVTNLKYYYKGKVHKTDKYSYFRQKTHRLVFEANQNNLTYDQYVNFLNSLNPSLLPHDWWTIPDGYDVHHIDENIYNNDINNLQLILKDEHSRLHAIQKHNNLRFVVVPDKIVSIKSVGEMETYDIKCYFPYNNFVAEGIVVHNSGKSTICGHAVAECQKKGGKALYIDGEHAVDKKYFQALGVNTEDLIICQPSCGEEGFNIAMEIINTGEIDLVIIDSDSSLIPKAVLDGDVGDSSIGKKARLNSNAYPKLKTALSEHNVCVIVVSQYREKIGVMFGNPTTTQGGHALKFYSDCRLEVTKSLNKEGDITVGNTTKVKAIKNKMSPPYRMAQFNVLFGVGIDKLDELINLANDFEILKVWGKSITYNETKHEGVEFKKTLMNDSDLFHEIRNKVMENIKNTEINVEENVESED